MGISLFWATNKDTSHIMLEDLKIYYPSYYPARLKIRKPLSDKGSINFPAEKEGFEPPVHLRVQLISSQSRSTAPALLQVNYETALLTSAAASLSRMADWTFNPLSSINFFASAAFVPWSRTIIGT